MKEKLALTRQEAELLAEAQKIRKSAEKNMPLMKLPDILGDFREHGKRKVAEE